MWPRKDFASTGAGIILLISKGPKYVKKAPKTLKKLLVPSRFYLKIPSVCILHGLAVYQNDIKARSSSSTSEHFIESVSKNVCDCGIEDMHSLKTVSCHLSLFNIKTRFLRLTSFFLLHDLVGPIYPAAWTNLPRHRGKLVQFTTSRKTAIFATIFHCLS